LGRLVLNHSTNIEGLIPILQKLALENNIKTITPAVISRARGRSSKLIIRLSVKTINGFKAIARKGNTAQEVFISTELNKDELKEIIENIKLKLPKDLNIPIVINHETNLKNYITKIINQYGEILLILNSIQLADKLFLQIKEQRLKRRKKLAQSTIGKFSTIKASAVALNPFILFDVAGSFALDTALISELSKIYGLKLKGESTRKIFKNISINNLFLGVTQIGVNTSFNLIKKIILLTAPFTNGLSLLPYGPIAIIQAAMAVYSTKILGKLAAKEIFIRSKASFMEPDSIIQDMNFNDPEIFNHINIYFSNRNLNNNLSKIENIKKFFVIKEKFSIENGMLTPTLKLKRYKIINKYKNNFEKLYN